MGHRLPVETHEGLGMAGHPRQGQRHIPRAEHRAAAHQIINHPGWILPVSVRVIRKHRVALGPVGGQKPRHAPHLAQKMRIAQERHAGYRSLWPRQLCARSCGPQIRAPEREIGKGASGHNRDRGAIPRVDFHRIVPAGALLEGGLPEPAFGHEHLHTVTMARHHHIADRA